MAEGLFIYFPGLTEAALEVIGLRARANSILAKYRAVVKHLKPGLLEDEGLLGRLEQELADYGRALEKHRVFLLQTRDAYIQAEGRESGAMPLPAFLGGAGGRDGRAYAWAARLLPFAKAAPIAPALKGYVSWRLEGYGGGAPNDAERL
jgi:hypothetical protein